MREQFYAQLGKLPRFAYITLNIVYGLSSSKTQFLMLWKWITWLLLSSKDDAKVKELFDKLENLREEFESIERPNLEIENPSHEPESPSSEKQQESASNPSREASAVTEVGKTGISKEPAVKSEQPFDTAAELAKLESEFGKVNEEYSAEEIGGWEFDELEKELRIGDSSTNKWNPKTQPT